LKDVGAPQPIVNTVTFKARAAGLTAGTAWRAGTATSPVRVVGVNIDLFDANGVLIASDVFAGILADYALSTLTADRRWTPPPRLGANPGRKYCRSR